MKSRKVLSDLTVVTLLSDLHISPSDDPGEKFLH